VAYVLNSEIAAVFRETAELLSRQGADKYRCLAYRAAAETLAGLDVDVGELLAREGRAGLIQLPTIGRSLAASIEEFALTGHCRTHDRLRGLMAPEDLYTRIPGIGEKLAARIHSELHIDSLEELEAAAIDGSLLQVAGVGEARAMAIGDHLARRLDASSRQGSSLRLKSRRGKIAHSSLSTAAILQVDREFRDLAEAGDLARIAPRRFNPFANAWMPVWHTQRDGWSLTVMNSNSELAHRLNKTHDWVIVVANRDGIEEQFTVVTEYRGDFSGSRMVRGREEECRETLNHMRDETASVVHVLSESL
jgi:hypothetical protein